MNTIDPLGARAAGRLRNGREFRAVYTRGERRTSRSFVVFILPTESMATRVGLTTSKRLGKAHERNRIRRRVREMLRYPPSPVGGADIVINPRRSGLVREFDQLRRELLSLLGTTSSTGSTAR